MAEAEEAAPHAIVPNPPKAIVSMLTLTVLLLSAFLFGGMLLYSFGFAAFLFSHLPADDAGAI